MKNRVRCLLLSALATVFVVLASPVAGDGSESGGAVAPEASAPICLAQTTPPEASQSIGTAAFCEADCEDGSTISYNCSGTCTATDQNCPSVRGQVTCNGTVVRRCPVCSCTVTTPCPDGSQLQCSSSNNDCVGGPGLCFVRCDGVYQWCPGHVGQIFC